MQFLQRQNHFWLPSRPAGESQKCDLPSGLSRLKSPFREIYFFTETVSDEVVKVTTREVRHCSFGCTK